MAAWWRRAPFWEGTPRARAGQASRRPPRSEIGDGRRPSRWYWSSSSGRLHAGHERVICRERQYQGRARNIFTERALCHRARGGQVIRPRYARVEIGGPAARVTGVKLLAFGKRPAEVDLARVALDPFGERIGAGRVDRLSVLRGLIGPKAIEILEGEPRRIDEDPVAARAAGSRSGYARDDLTIRFVGAGHGGNRRKHDARRWRQVLAQESPVDVDAAMN